MKEGRAAKKEIGFVELAPFTLSFSFHPNPVVAERPPSPAPFCLPYLLK